MYTYDNISKYVFQAACGCGGPRRPYFESVACLQPFAWQLWTGDGFCHKSKRGGRYPKTARKSRFWHQKVRKHEMHF